LVPGGACHLDLPVQRRDPDPVPHRRLHDVDAQLVDDVLVTPVQLRMRLDPEHDVEVARRAGPITRLAFAGQADLRAGIHAGRDPDLQPFRLLDAPLSVALAARLLEAAPLPPTLRAGDPVPDP